MKRKQKQKQKQKARTATAFVAKRMSICPRCGKTIREGQDAVACDGEYLHPKCYDDMVEEG